MVTAGYVWKGLSCVGELVLAVANFVTVEGVYRSQVKVS